MKCPYCGDEESKVIDSRPTEDGERIRRRRECLGCGKRFTTYEAVERPMLMVQKKDGSYEPFDRHKLVTGIFNAIKKGVIVMTRDKDVSADNLNDDRLIMDFIKKRNAEGARTAMRLHILHAMEHL